MPLLDNQLKPVQVRLRINGCHNPGKVGIRREKRPGDGDQILHAQKLKPRTQTALGVPAAVEAQAESGARPGPIGALNHQVVYIEAPTVRLALPGNARPNVRGPRPRVGTGRLFTGQFQFPQIRRAADAAYDALLHLRPEFHICAAGFDAQVLDTIGPEQTVQRQIGTL